jgi:acylphosphatase
MAGPARRFTVHGRVQGVFFRDSTRREAQRLGISGHAINLPDGTVEVLASGPEEALAELERWLHEGPPMSRVTRVEAVSTQVAIPPGFLIG